MSDWDDIIPVLQDDGPYPVVPIAYTFEYTNLMNIFRGVMKIAEYSKRAVNLTSEILDISAANYTVWQYRRHCLYNIGCDLYEELDYVDTFAEDNPKNYQIWFHRRAITEKLDDYSRELPFCSLVISVDAKNYHAWAHRQWVLKKSYNVPLWDEELKFVTRAIETDVRNNSAWNQRWFVVHNRPRITTDGGNLCPPLSRSHPLADIVPEDVIVREADFVWSWIYCAAFNESAWSYLRGIVMAYPTLLLVETLRRCQDMLQGGCSSPFLLGLTADLREKEDSVDGRQHALALLQRLVEVDAVRAKYWARRMENMTTTV